MTLDQLHEAGLARRQQRIAEADQRLIDLYIAYKAYMSLGLRHHFTKTIDRALKARDDGSLVGFAVDEVERILIVHKRRCDRHGVTHALNT